MQERRKNGMPLDNLLYPSLSALFSFDVPEVSLFTISYTINHQ